MRNRLFDLILGLVILHPAARRLSAFRAPAAPTLAAPFRAGELEGALGTPFAEGPPQAQPTQAPGSRSRRAPPVDSPGREA